MTCHYWGRQPPQKWVWLSANDFERTGTVIELALMKSTLWGVNIPLPAAGYAWLRHDGRERRVASPMTGLITRRDTSITAVELAVRALRGFRLRAEAPPDSFVDVGNGITQSLSARCEIGLPGGAPTTHLASAALEFRRQSATNLT